MTEKERIKHTRKSVGFELLVRNVGTFHILLIKKEKRCSRGRTSTRKTKEVFEITPESSRGWGGKLLSHMLLFPFLNKEWSKTLPMLLTQLTVII